MQNRENFELGERIGCVLQLFFIQFYGWTFNWELVVGGALETVQLMEWCFHTPCLVD